MSLTGCHLAFVTHPQHFRYIYMDKLFRGKEDFVLPYLDHVIIFSKTKESHIRHLNEALKILKDAQEIMNEKNANFIKEN